MKQAILFLLTIVISTPIFAQQDNFDKGMESLKKEHYNKAVRKFSKCIESNPENHQALYYRTLANSIKGKKAEQSFNDIDKAISLHQKNANYYYLRLFINSVAQDTGTVYADASKTLQLDSNFAEAYYARAKIYAILWIISFDIQSRLDWCYTHAKQDLDKAIELKPDFYQAYAFRAYISRFYNPINQVDIFGDLDKSIEIQKKQRKAYSYRAILGIGKRKPNQFLGDMFRAYVWHRKEHILPVEFLLENID